MVLLYEEEVRQIICTVLELDSTVDIAEKDDLQYSGMDSLNCMQAMLQMEEIFDIQIPDEKLGLKFIRNIHDICKLVEEIKNEQPI